MPGNPEETTGNQPKADGDTEAGRITTIADLKTEQDRQAGVLDQLVDLVKGGGSKAPAADKAATPDAEPAAGLTPDAIRQAIRDVNAEAAADQAKTAHDAEHERLKSSRDAAEHQPRDAMPNWKNRLQKVMFGADA